MASRSAACVFGGARLISSPSSRLQKTGPGRNSKLAVRWSKTDEPVTSEGSRSGVNCTRPKRRPVAVANERAMSVLATPGTSSSRTCPSASSASSTSSRTSRLPTTARSTSSRIASAGAATWRGCGSVVIAGEPPGRRGRRSGARAPARGRRRHRGRGRSGRTSSQVSGASSSCAACGWASSSTPRRRRPSAAISRRIGRRRRCRSPAWLVAALTTRSRRSRSPVTSPRRGSRCGRGAAQRRQRLAQPAHGAAAATSTARMVSAAFMPAPRARGEASPGRRWPPRADLRRPGAG